MSAKATAIILAAAIFLTITGCGKTAEGSPSSVAESMSEPESEDLSYLDDGEVPESIIVLNDGRGLLLYSGSYENGLSFAEMLSEYKKRIGENVNVYSMIIPTAAAFYLPEKFYDEGATAREPPHIDDINTHLSGVIPVDVYSALEAHTSEDIYFKTDHHRTQLGAYYVPDFRGFEGSLTELADYKGITDLLFCESIDIAISDYYEVFAKIM